MSETCEMTGHDYESVTKMTYKIPGGTNDPDIPAMLSLLSFAGLVAGTIAGTVGSSILPFIGGLVGFIIVMIVYSHARFFTDTVALVCRRCGTKITP